MPFPAVFPRHGCVNVPVLFSVFVSVGYLQGQFVVSARRFPVSRTIVIYFFFIYRRLLGKYLYYVFNVGSCVAQTFLLTVSAKPVVVHRVPNVGTYAIPVAAASTADRCKVAHALSKLYYLYNSVLH